MSAGPSLLALAVAALQGSRLVQMNEELNTFHVLPAREGAEAVLGVVLDGSRTVTLYYVWPEPVSESRTTAVTEFAARANTNLFLSSFEFNLETGMLALRAGVEFGELVDEMRRDVFAGLLVNVLDDVETEATNHAKAVDAVTVDSSPLDAIALIES